MIKMTSAEKIIEGILAADKKTAEEILEKARIKAEQIIAEANETAAKLGEQSRIDTAKQTELINKTGGSAAELIKRDAALSVRRELIEKVLTDAQKRINALDDNDYFAFLLNIVNKSGCNSGVLYLGSKDLSRNTDTFKTKLAEKSIQLGSTAADIENGFILKNGDIEINSTVSALIREKYSVLVDKVNQILFTQEGEG